MPQNISIVVKKACRKIDLLLKSIGQMGWPKTLRNHAPQTRMKTGSETQ